jgi:heme-degrading monooxygenase HmoA
MPALPWVQRQPIEPDRRYAVMASRLPLKAYRFTPGFLVDTWRIRRQLAEADGLVGYGLNAQLTAKTFWTYSVWADRESLEAFAAADPHRRITQGLRARMLETRFDFLTVLGTDIARTWDQRMAPVR